MPTTPRPQFKNHILASLPPADYKRLAPHLETVEMPHGEIVQQSNKVMEHVFFPENSMVSLISRTPTGQAVEVGIVGYEGVAGISAVLGVDKSPYQMMVQVDDTATRLPAEVLRAEFKRGAALHDLLLRYTQSLLLQTSQIAACNRLHNVSERLARWLLMSNDRCATDDLPFTQEFLSLMLGVRRAGVTEAAIVLQTEGYISYHRGHIRITDRKGLEDFSCDCYTVLKADFDLLLA